MKTSLVLLVCCVFFISCNAGLGGPHRVTEEQIWEYIQGILAEGAVPSSIRPMPDIMSEQEVLIKAAEFIYSIGGLDPSFYVYQRNPVMLTAKIETPVLLYDSNGSPISYLFFAVDDHGSMLMMATARPNIDITPDFFRVTGGPALLSNISDESLHHFITKRDAQELIQNSFPGMNISEPIALTNLILEGNRHHHEIFWYFTVSNSGSEYIYDEYLLYAFIPGWRSVPGGLSNRSEINVRGSPHLGRDRLARLDIPLQLREKIEQVSASQNARSSAYGQYSSSVQEPMSFTVVPLQ